MKKAFTTAELLISLMVIGVIAALVIPVFTKDYNTRIRTAAIKDSFATIMSAVQRSCADKNVSYFSQTGYMDSAESRSEFLKKYLRGKMENNETKKFASSYTSLSGLTGSFSGEFTYFTMQSGAALAMNCRSAALRKFQNGVLVLDSTQKVCTFYMDTNGKSGPNKGGIDMFTFHIGSNSNDVAILNTPVCKYNALGDNCLYQLIRNDWDIDNLANETSLKF